MKTRFAFPLGLALFVAIPSFAQERREEQQRREEPQRHEEQQHPQERGANPPRANHGHIPDPPPKRDPHAKPEPERHDHDRQNSTPHVNNDHWYGHDRPDDKRYHIDRPFEHGRFERFGPNYRWRIERFDRDHHRFWFPGGFFFEVAAWDWPACEGWCWDCADDFVIYQDDDHIGWYLLYNVHTGVYVHVVYMGT